MAGAMRWGSVARILSREISRMIVSWLRDRWLREKNVSEDDDEVGSLREPKTSSVWEGWESALQRLVMGGGMEVMGFRGSGGIDGVEVSSTLALRELDGLPCVWALLLGLGMTYLVVWGVV